MGRRVRKFDGPSGRGLWWWLRRSFIVPPFRRPPSTASRSLSRPAGKVLAPATKRGNAFPRPPGRLYGFRRQRRHKKWHRGRRTSPAQRYYIPPEGESPEPACKAKPITGRTLAAQGQRPGGAINPRGEAASTYGNTGKHRAGPDPDRVERRLNLHTHKGLDFPFCAIGLEKHSAD